MTTSCTKPVIILPWKDSWHCDEDQIGLQEQEDQQGHFGAPNIQEVDEEGDTKDKGVSNDEEESTIGHPNKSESKSEADLVVHHKQEEGVVEDDANTVEPEGEEDADTEEDVSPTMVQELESDLGEY